MQIVGKLLWFLLFIVGFGSSCQENILQEKLDVELQSLQNNRTALLIDSSTQFLQDGNVVLRKGNDVISDIFSKLNRTDKSFSHCGIAFFENSKWYVYHSIGGEDNPDQKLKRDLFEHFVIPSHNKGFGICNLLLTKPEIAKLHVIVDSFYTKKIPFDMQFDLESNDRLYCAEMVYKAIQLATSNDSFFTVTMHNGFKFVSTDNIFVNKQAQILCRTNY